MRSDVMNSISSSSIMAELTVPEWKRSTDTKEKNA